MSFASIPGGVVALGWLGIALGLYLLQRLRVRHREMDVPTTLFWREAVEETRARVLVRRFRHPWAYLLLLSITSLLWFAAAGLRTDASAGGDVLLVMDGSAGMSHGTRFADAREMLLADAAALPVASREVWWSGAQTRLLLRRGEEAKLLEERLAGLEPEAAPARIEERLLAHVQGRDDARPLEVRVYGDAPLRESTLELMPESVDVIRRAPEPETRDGNRGIVAVGVAESASGAWDRVDVLLEIVGATDGLSVALDGEAVVQPYEQSTTAAGGRQLVFRDLPARGQLLTAELPADAYTMDDIAQLVVPDRPPLRVAISPALVGVLAPLIEADPALVDAAGGEADLVVRFAGEALGQKLPALEFAPAEEGSHAFLVRHDAYDEPGLLLQAAYDRLGLAEIDALSLAQELQRPVTLGAETGAGPAVVVWDVLLDPVSGFPGTRSFPMFLARSLRWLAGAGGLAPYAEAGAALAFAEGGWTDAAGALHDPAGGAFVPPAAGIYATDDGDRVAVSLLDLSSSEPVPAFGLAAAPAVGADGGWPMWTWLALLAFALLIAEWALYQRGRMP